MGNSEDPDMNNTVQKEDSNIKDKYIALTMEISSIENRLRCSDVSYLFMNVLVLLFTLAFTSYLIHSSGYILIFVDLAFIFTCIIVGMAINIYWIAFAMRLQLNLKLHHFQARFLERKMNCDGEYFFSDKSIFFDPDIRVIESPDNKEILHYPTSGATRMDGFIGSLKPRHLSWLLPCLFIFIYWAIFFLVLPFI
jgi:hypothetical protein